MNLVFFLLGVAATTGGFAYVLTGLVPWAFLAVCAAAIACFVAVANELEKS